MLSTSFLAPHHHERGRAMSDDLSATPSCRRSAATRSSPEGPHVAKLRITASWSLLWVAATCDPGAHHHRFRSGSRGPSRDTEWHTVLRCQDARFRKAPLRATELWFGLCRLEIGPVEELGQQLPALFGMLEPEAVSAREHLEASVWEKPRRPLACLG